MDETEEQNVEVQESMVVVEAADAEPLSTAQPERVADSPTDDSKSESAGEREEAVVQASRYGSAKTDSASTSASTVAKPISVSAPVAAAPAATPDKIDFSDVDNAVDTAGKESSISAPKTIARLEQIAAESANRRREEEAEEDEDDQLKIGAAVKLEIGEINDLSRPVSVKPPPKLEGVEVLPSL